MTMLSDPALPDDLSRTLLDAQKGDQSAWEVLFRECYPKVRRVVRRNSIVRCGRFMTRLISPAM